MVDQIVIPHTSEDALKSALKALVPKTLRRQFLKTRLDEARAVAERQFQLDHADDLAELADLEVEYLQGYRTFVDSVHQIAEMSDRSQLKFFEGTVRLQIRSRPGEYDSAELLEWAKKYPQAYRPPKKGTEWLTFLQSTRLDLLVPDEKAAVEIATAKYESGQRIFPDAPVPVDTYLTEPSTDTFTKVLTDLLVELTVDARDLPITDDEPGEDL